jgi:uncharacterized membrane protein
MHGDITAREAKSMNEKAGTENECNSAKTLKYEQRITHLQTGESNSQSVARFIDSKAAVTVGVVPVLLGIIAAATNWIVQFECWQWIASGLGMCFTLPVAMLLVVVSLLLLIFSCQTIYYAFRAITPRTPSSTRRCVLFPYTRSGEDDFEQQLELFLDEPCEKDVFEDYRRQLKNMSVIVERKIHYVDKSIANLQRLVYSSVVMLVLMLVAIAFGVALSGANINESNQKADKDCVSTPLPMGASQDDGTSEESAELTTQN